MTSPLFPTNVLRRTSSGRILIACAAGLLCDGCSKPPPPIAQLPAPTVKVAKPIGEEFQDTEEFTGRAEGSEFVEIRARVSGYLDKIHFRPGSYIDAGQPLFDIDPRPYEASLEQAEANVAQAQARTERLAQDLNRAKDLVAKKIMTAQEFDKIVGDNIEAAAAMKSLEAQVKQAKLNLEFTEIKAPIKGLVSREQITVGNLVQADQTVLTTIAAYDPIYLYFDMDEHVVLRILNMIRAGTFKSARENKVPVDGAVADSEGFPFHGFVNFVDNRIDPSTGTMNMRGEFPNPKSESGATFITPGMFIRVRVPMGPPQPALQISRKAVVTDQGDKVVYVVNGQNKIEARKVKLGKPTDHGLQIVESGLTADDTIVVSGIQRVRPGIEIKPETVSMRKAAE